MKNNIRKIKVKPYLTEEQADKMAGKFVRDEDCKMLIREDADVYCAETGILLAVFRKNVIPIQVQVKAYDNLLAAATSTDSRGTAGGGDEEGVSKLRVNKNGRVSKQSIAKNFVNSGVAGYYDRSTRFPNCRLTAFNKHHFDKFKKAYPIIKFVNDMFKQLVPARYKVQEQMATKTSKDFLIPGTVFTTVTVNKDYQTAIHKDAGDLKGGFGNLVALRKGQFDGCYFVLVRWGVGFDLCNGDVLLTDVHQWHGNTPMRKLNEEATRLSLVMYYREKMIKCGTMKQELHRVQKRKKGEAL